MKAFLFVAASTFALAMTLCAGPAAANIAQADGASKAVSMRASGHVDVAVLRRDQSAKRSAQTKRAKR